MAVVQHQVLAHACVVSDGLELNVLLALQAIGVRRATSAVHALRMEFATEVAPTVAPAPASVTRLLRRRLMVRNVNNVHQVFMVLVATSVLYRVGFMENVRMA